jgi:hypothetical protein
MKQNKNHEKDVAMMLRNSAAIDAVKLNGDERGEDALGSSVNDESRV